MNKILFILLAAVLGSCGVLTKSQIKNINAFGEAATAYTLFPSTVFKEKAVLRFDEAVLRSTQLPSADLIKQNLANAQSAYKTALRLSDTFDLSLQLIQQYAVLLAQLSAETYVDDLATNATELGANLTGLIETYNTRLPANPLPAGIGAAVSKAVFLTGERLTRLRQAKELKAFIPQGERLIQTTVKNIVGVFETDSPSVKTLLESDRTKFIDTYTILILSDSNKVTYSSLWKYADALADYETLEALRRGCVQAAQELTAAHTKLAASMRQKAKVHEIFKETQRLITSVQELLKLVSALRTTEPTTAT